MAEHEMLIEVFGTIVHLKPFLEYVRGVPPLHFQFPVRSQLDDGTKKFAPQTLAIGKRPGVGGVARQKMAFIDIDGLFQQLMDRRIGDWGKNAAFPPCFSRSAPVHRFFLSPLRISVVQTPRRPPSTNPYPG